MVLHFSRKFLYVLITKKAILPRNGLVFGIPVVADRSTETVDGAAKIVLHFLELARSHSSDIFELSRQMLNTLVSELVGNFAQGQFPVPEKFLRTFDTLQDEIVLDGDPFHR